MSAPDPKKWEATAEEFKALTVVLNGPMDDAGVIAADKIIDSFARRRAIAELKALVKEMCWYCDHNRAFVPDYFGGSAVLHDDEEGGTKECGCPEIRDRIAAIEAEQ